MINWTEIVGAAISLLGTVAAIVAAQIAARSERSRKKEVIRTELLIEGVQSSLEGLCQLGANHGVTDARDKLKDFMRKEAAK